MNVNSLNSLISEQNGRLSPEGSRGRRVNYMLERCQEEVFWAPVGLLKGEEVLCLCMSRLCVWNWGNHCRLFIVK